MPIKHTLPKNRARLRRRGIAARIARYGVELREGSANGVGPLSVPWDGYTAFAGCAFSTSGEQTFIRRSLRSLARSSIGGMSDGFVRRS